jgi:hypothetical protein
LQQAASLLIKEINNQIEETIIQFDELREKEA